MTGVFDVVVGFECLVVTEQCFMVSFSCSLRVSLLLSCHYLSSLEFHLFTLLNIVLMWLSLLLISTSIVRDTY